MKKILNIAATAVIASFVLAAGSSLAQTTDPKLDWATKVVALQQGPELDRLVEQLTQTTTQDLLQNWAPKLQNDVPANKQEQVREALNAELKKYADDVVNIISGKVGAVSKESLVSAYMERFSLDELQQIAAFFESPVIKKYQASAPELANVFVQKLVEATRTDVTARASQFDAAAEKIMGSVATGKSTPAPAGKSKAPAKK